MSNSKHLAFIGLRLSKSARGTTRRRAPADVERELTDRPLAPPVDTPEILADDLFAPNEIVYLQGAWYVLDEADAAILEIVEGEDQPTVFADGFDTPVEYTHPSTRARSPMIRITQSFTS